MKKRSFAAIREETTEAKPQRKWLRCVSLCRKALEFSSQGNPKRSFSLQADLAYCLSKDESASCRGSLEESIQIYKKLLASLDRERSPETWASLHVALARNYNSRIEGDAVENREKALQCFNLALLVFSKDKHPKEWAAVKAALGLSYVRRLSGWQKTDTRNVALTRKRYFTKAIRLYQEALEVYTEQQYPDLHKELTGNIESLKDAVAVLKRELARLRTGPEP